MAEHQVQIINDSENGKGFLVACNFLSKARARPAWLSDSRAEKMGTSFPLLVMVFLHLPHQIDLRVNSPGDLFRKCPGMGVACPEQRLA